MAIYPGQTLFPGPDLFPGVQLFPGTPPAGWVFRPPTELIRYRLLPRTGLVGYFERGLTVWRNAGVWHTGDPTPADLDGADRLYRGGYDYALTDAERAELVAAGYSDYIEELHL